MRLWDVWCMTWAEFVIKKQGWFREQDRRFDEVRLLSWHSMIAPSHDPKKLPKTFDQFMTGIRNRANESQIEALRKAREEYNKKRNANKD